MRHEVKTSLFRRLKHLHAVANDIDNPASMRQKATKILLRQRISFTDILLYDVSSYSRAVGNYESEIKPINL